MGNIATMLGSLFIILLAGLMVFALNYVFIRWIGRFLKKDYDAVTWAFGITAYVITSHLFWIGLYLLKVPVNEMMFLLFYLLAFFILLAWLYKRYDFSILKSALYSFLLVIVIFLAEMLNSYFIAILLKLMDLGLSNVVRSLL